MSFYTRTFAATVLALSTILIGACTTTTTGGAVGADRSQFMLVSSGELNQLAAQGYADLKSQASQKGVLNRDRDLLHRVRTITSRIRPQTGVFRSDAPGWAWEANVISSNQLNAFVMPGGKVMIFSGLVDRLHLSDDEIAIVLGHEVAHALREHSREQISQALAAQSMIGLGSTIFGLGSGTANLAGTGYQALLATRFSRSHESEADRIGLELTARAGYDPRAGITLWNKMLNARQGGGSPEFLSTHPAESSRVHQIQALLPTVMPLYNVARRGH